jgi:hypothetical protein
MGRNLIDFFEMVMTLVLPRVRLHGILYVCPRRKVVWGLKSFWEWNNAAILKHIFLKFRVGDGSKIYLWLDFWHPDGILYDHYGYRDIYDARSKFDAELSSVVRGTN